jgi:hypothetical protein
MHYPPLLSSVDGNGAKKPEAVTPKAWTPAPLALRAVPRPIVTELFPRIVPLVFSRLIVDLARCTCPDCPDPAAFVA